MQKNFLYLNIKNHLSFSKKGRRMQSKTLSFKQAVELHSTARFTELHGHRHVFAYFIYSILLILLLMLILDLCKPVSQPVHTTVELLKGAGVYRGLHFTVHGRIRIVDGTAPIFPADLPPDPECHTAKWLGPVLRAAVQKVHFSDTHLVVLFHMGRQ